MKDWAGERGWAALANSSDRAQYSLSPIPFKAIPLPDHVIGRRPTWPQE